jgi:hypothetical protein
LSESTLANIVNWYPVSLNSNQFCLLSICIQTGDEQGLQVEQGTKDRVTLRITLLFSFHRTCISLMFQVMH